MPAFNHTRGDSPLTPCPLCREEMTADELRKVLAHVLSLEENLARIDPTKPVPDDMLDAVVWHACSSGTSTPPQVRNALLSLVAEVKEHRARRPG